MEEAHQYRVIAWWTSGRTGIAKSNSAPNAIHFTAPPEFGGLQGRWTPEDLLLGAIASCYTTTFRALAESSRFEYADLEVEVQGTVHKGDSGYSFSEILMRPNLTISSEEARERALLLLQKTEAVCLVSRALSITQTFESRVLVSKSLPVGWLHIKSESKLYGNIGEPTLKGVRDHSNRQNCSRTYQLRWVAALPGLRT